MNGYIDKVLKATGASIGLCLGDKAATIEQFRSSS
jgi:hypothetical protein